MAEPVRSAVKYQNLELAAEAMEMSRDFIDVGFLRRFTREQDPERAWEMYFTHTQRQCRRVLDGLLLTIPPEEIERVVELAGSVEVFCLPSTATETRVFQNPGTATGHLIGVSPLTIELSTEIAWGMNMAHPSFAGPPSRASAEPGVDTDTIAREGRRVLDEHMSGYVRAFKDVRTKLPVPLTDIALMDHPEHEWPMGQSPADYRDAALAFIISHELAHIRHGDLLPGGRERAQHLLRSEFSRLMKVPDEMNEELAADAMAFMPTYNFQAGACYDHRRQTAGTASDTDVARESARRASEACQSFYSAVCVLGLVEWLRGDNASATRLLSAAGRAPFVLNHIKHHRAEELAGYFGPALWTEWDAEHRAAHDDWREHFTVDVLPALWAAMGLPVPDELPETVTGPLYGELLADRGVNRELLSLVRARLAEEGRDHSGNLALRVELAATRERAGDVRGALADLAELLPLVENETGAHSEQSLTTRHNIAFLLAKSGQVAEALDAFMELLTRQAIFLGADHPDALETHYNLAVLRGRAGDARGAAAELDRLVEKQERVQGAGHGRTRYVRATREFWHLVAEDPAEAAARALAERERDAGPGHSGTAAARAALAALREEAVRVAERLLADQEEVLGAHHPDTAFTLGKVADWRGAAGDTGGAISALGRLLAVQEEDLGPDHPAPLTTRVSLVTWTLKAGDFPTAAATAERLLADQVRVLGPDHTLTLMTRGQLGHARGAAGDAAGAADAYADLLGGLERVLGPEAPGTRSIRELHAEWRRRAGRN